MKYRRRYHEIPADQGERSGVAGLHTCDLAVRGGKENGDQPSDSVSTGTSGSEGNNCSICSGLFFLTSCQFCFHEWRVGKLSARRSARSAHAEPLPDCRADLVWPLGVSAREKFETS